MKTKVLISAGVLAFSGLLQASTSLTLTSSSTAGFANQLVNNYVISPYTGVLGGTYSGSPSRLQSGTGTGVTLFCDDFNDAVSVGNTIQYTVNVVSASANGFTTAELTDARFTNTTLFPSPTNLYDEMAWLATQMTDVSAGDQTEIQEAIGQMTDTTADKSVSPDGTAAGETQNVSQWTADAVKAIAGTGSYFTGTTASSYLTPDYSNWEVVTEVGAAGHQSGSGIQEFLAYSQNPAANHTGVAATPEPASFVLIGSGFLIGALVGRRRSKKPNA